MHVHTPYGTIYREGDREWFAGSREQFETAKAWEMRMESNISAGDSRDPEWCYVCDRPKIDCGCVENGGTY